MKHQYSVFAAFAAALLFASNAHALIVFGKSNEEAQVDYSNANAAQASVVSTASNCSAVYIGNGWFLTANHVSVALDSQIKQNGKFASVDRIDNTLNQTFGVDLKLFHVGDVSALSDLQSVKLSADIYSKMSDTVWDGDTLVRGSELLLVGAGYGRSANSAPDSTTVPNDGRLGTIRFGTATAISKATCEVWDGNNRQFGTSDYPVIEIVAEAREGAAGALTGDSGSGMFFEYGGEFYLVGTTVWVDSTESASTITFGQIESDMEYKTKYSHTYGVNLKDFLQEIGNITGVPVPEPSDFAAAFGLLVLGFAGYRKFRA